MIRWNWDNPVVTKEFRGRMRGARAYWLLFSYLAVLSLTLFLSYLAWWQTRSFTSDYGGAGFTVGRQFFEVLLGAQAILIMIITPALTAGAISIEREQRTFDLLISTTLPARSIILGKLTASVAFVSLLLTASLPLLSLCFLLGGVSPGEVFFAYLLLLSQAFLFGAIGLAWSVVAAKTATATALAYGTVFLILIGTIPLAAPLFGSGFMISQGFAALNPLGAALGAVASEHYYGWILPAWLPALLINLTLGALLLAISINRLSDFAVSRAGWVRGLTLLLATITFFFGNGMVISGGGLIGGGFTQALLPMMLLLGILLAFGPILTTGDLTEKQSGTQSVTWNIRRILTEARLPTGFPMTLFLLGLGAIFLVLAKGLSHTFVLPPAMLGQSLLLLGVVLFGIAGMGFLLSIVIKNRWLAMTALYVLLVLLIAMPYFDYANVPDWQAAAAARGPLVNTLYLCPIISLEEICAKPIGYDLLRSMPVLRGVAGFRAVPLWWGTAVLYCLLGTLGYGLGFALQRSRKPAEESPHETSKTA